MYKARLLMKLENNVTKLENGCIIWNGYKNKKGYGRIWVDGKFITITRLVMYFKHGFDLSSNALICHICDSKSCINDEHLYVGTSSSNMVDRGEFKTHCINGHLYDSMSTYRDRSGHRRCRICSDRVIGKQLENKK